MQSVSLGYAVSSYNDHGHAVLNQKGELVCEAPFPSMPVCFWADKEKQRYKESYFSTFDNVWMHSDFVQINDNGSVKLLGRSDTTLNRGGVRIGTAEIYSVLEAYSEINDALVVHHVESDQIFAFIQMKSGAFTDTLKQRVHLDIKNSRSPRHCPDQYFVVSAIPYTSNGKKIEKAIQRIFSGTDYRHLSTANHANPDVLKDYAELYNTIVASPVYGL